MTPRQTAVERPIRHGAVALVALLLAAFSVFAPPARAVLAAAPVITGVRVEGPNRPTVGDHLRLIISLEAESGTTVTLAPGTLQNELMLLKTPEVKTKDKGGGLVEVTLTAEVAPFFVGDLSLKPLRLRYAIPGGASGEIETPSVRIFVAGTVPEGSSLEPLPLKAQAGFPAVGTPAVYFVALAVLAAALCLTLGLLFWRGHTRSGVAALEPEPEEIALGPEDSARRDLDRAAGDLAGGNLPAYYAILAATVRGYLTDRFGFPAFALTTAELQTQMVTRGMDRWQARLVSGLLDQCDSVVFARYRPAPDRADADLTAAYEIVEMSRPREMEEALA